MNVSICIPTYNQGAYVAQSVRSAWNQTIRPKEIIVFDDCSTDDTPAILQQLQNEIPVLRVFRQPVNVGISKNVDACLRKSSGDWVIRLDSDDLLAENYTEVLGAHLENHPGCGYAHAAVQEIDQNGSLLKKRVLARREGLQLADDALRAAVKGYRVAANIIMFRRKALEEVNFVSSPVDFAEDYYMVTAISVLGYHNYYCSDVLAFYRVWVDQKNVRQKRKLNEINGFHKVFEDVIEPAFSSRNWNLSSVRKSRTARACEHADCLSWEFYSLAEKKELREALQRLSPARKAAVFASMYFNGWGRPLKWSTKTKYFLRSVVKRALSVVRR